MEKTPYIVNKKTFFDRFRAGIKKYGYESKFRKEYEDLLQQLRYDELEEFFDGWDVPNKD